MYLLQHSTAYLCCLLGCITVYLLQHSTVYRGCLLGCITVYLLQHSTLYQSCLLGCITVYLLQHSTVYQCCRLGCITVYLLQHSTVYRGCLLCSVAVYLVQYSTFYQCCILIMSDNSSVVNIVNKTTSKNGEIMKLVRQLVSACLRYNILFRCKHVPGYQNVIADHLSRFQTTEARELAPWLDMTLANIPAHLQSQVLTP